MGSGDEITPLAVGLSAFILAYFSNWVGDPIARFFDKSFPLTSLKIAVISFKNRLAPDTYFNILAKLKVDST